MAKRDYTVNFTVTYEFKGEIHTKDFDSFETAYAAYSQIRRKFPDIPRRLESLINNSQIVLGSGNWTHGSFKRAELAEWRRNAEQLLKNAKMKRPQIDALLNCANLREIISSYNVDALLELDGVGEKTALKAIRTLRPISKSAFVQMGKSREFTRVTLNNGNIDDGAFVVDVIRKGVSPIEQRAYELGGANALIHVTSYIEDAKESDLDACARAEYLAEEWEKAVRGGLTVYGVKYVPFGHGTNAAKECRTIWVKECIYDELKTWMQKNVQKNWQTTAAKLLAYMCGLQSVTRTSVKIPFMPEDFAIFPSVIDNITENVYLEKLDGSEEKLDNHTFEVNRSDGYFMVNIPDQMIPELLNRMIARGDDPEEARETLRLFMADTSVNSYRANGTAFKGCGDKRIDVHGYLRSKGITKTPDGRDINSIAIFVDETVVKTTIGENGAYKTVDDLYNAIRDEFDLGICVKAHAKSKKDVSYQVVQALCEASGSTVRAMAKPTVDRINGMHTIEGASRAVNREMGHVIRAIPEIAKVRSVKERIETALTNAIDDAFGGKLLKDSYYAFITPDPFYVLNGWFGLERKGCLESGQFHIPTLTYNKKTVFWRSPVMHPNSVRVVENVRIPKEFSKFIKGDGFVITMNSIDDVSLAAAADWDGDHGNVSQDDNLITAAEETLKVWNRLVIWETPKTKKGAITRKEELDYFVHLTRRNELGLTVYGLNALLNRLLLIKNRQTGESYIKVVPISHRGVNFKVFAGNVLVDASKHGGAEIKEPAESSMSSNMLQPWAKSYRDAVFAKCSRKELDERADFNKLNKKHMVSTLNRLFAVYAHDIDRSTKIYDLPDAEFDVHKLMYDTDETMRGLVGLIRRGDARVIKIDGDTCHPDQGLFDSLARRVEHDRLIYMSDDSRKDGEDTSFEDAWRANALAEIEAFAVSMGKTLQDAYDVITFRMFRDIDNQYATMDGKYDFIRDALWKAYWLIFGGMAEDAASRWEENEEDAD